MRAIECRCENVTLSALHKMCPGFKLRRFATGFRVERHVSWKPCAKGLDRYVISCLVGVSEMSAQSAATCV